MEGTRASPDSSKNPPFAQASEAAEGKLTCNITEAWKNVLKMPCLSGKNRNSEENSALTFVYTTTTFLWAVCVEGRKNRRPSFPYVKLFSLSLYSAQKCCWRGSSAVRDKTRKGSVGHYENIVGPFKKLQGSGSQHKLSRLDSMEKGPWKSILNKCPSSIRIFEKYWWQVYEHRYQSQPHSIWLSVLTSVGCVT